MHIAPIGLQKCAIVTRDLSIIELFLFMIPRIFNTKKDTIQYQ